MYDNDGIAAEASTGNIYGHDQNKSEGKNNELIWMAGSVVLSDRPTFELKSWRKKFGIKQSDLAKKMNITPSVLSDYEKGRRPSPGTNFVKRYLLALHELSEVNGKSAPVTQPIPVTQTDEGMLPQ